MVVVAVDDVRFEVAVTQRGARRLLEHEAAEEAVGETLSGVRIVVDPGPVERRRLVDEDGLRLRTQQAHGVCGATDKDVERGELRAHLAAEELREWCARQGYKLMIQGEELSRSEMLDCLRNEPHSIIFGTESFWNGVDVPIK